MRISERGVTLLELLFVCGLFALVLTVLAASLKQTAASQKQLDEGSEVLVNLELARLKISELLRRSELGASMEIGTPTNELALQLYQLKSSGQPRLDALGMPVVGELATLGLEGERNLVLRGVTTQVMLSRLDEGAIFEVTRISENRFRFRLTTGQPPKAGDGPGEPRELVFEAGF